MFEHKHLDGKWNRVIPSTEAFLQGDVLECRDSIGTEPKEISRRQYGVVGDLLVERCLPPETMGDRWSHDNVDTPWWVKVMNPPHMGIVAEFNLFNGGLHRKPFDSESNVVGFTPAGESIYFRNGIYSVKRESDGQELSASTLVELRNGYCS